MCTQVVWVLLQVRAGIKSVGVNGDILKQALENSGVAVLASDDTDMTGATVATSTGDGDGEGEGEVRVKTSLLRRQQLLQAPSRPQWLTSSQCHALLQPYSQ